MGIFVDNNLYHFDLCFSLPWNILGDAEAPMITALSWDILVTFAYWNQALLKIFT